MKIQQKQQQQHIKQKSDNEHISSNGHTNKLLEQILRVLTVIDYSFKIVLSIIFAMRTLTFPF